MTGSRSPLVGLAAAMLLLAAAPQAAQAQFNAECGVGETQLVVKVGGTDKLTKCTDYFDDVDPIASVLVGNDRLGVTKTTRRIDNSATPNWNQALDFGCVEKDSRITFRVRDWDYFSDEQCLGPLSIIDDWPPSGQPMLLCETAAADGTHTGCVSFVLFYGEDAANGASSPDLRPLDTTTTTSTSTEPDPAAVDPTPAPAQPKANATSPTTPAPHTATPPVAPPPAPPAASSNATATNTKQRPPAVGAPAPEAAQEKEKAHRGHKKGKGAAVAFGIIGTLAMVGAAVGLYASRRRRRAQEHGQGLDIDAQGGGGVRGMPDETGSVAVL